MGVWRLIQGGAPRNIWEAVTTLRRLEEEREVARRQGEAARERVLQWHEAVVWGFVRNFAEQLVSRGEAPEGFGERLWQMLGVAPG